MSTTEATREAAARLLNEVNMTDEPGRFRDDIELVAKFILAASSARAAEQQSLLDDPIGCPFCGDGARAHTVGDRGYWRVSCNSAVTCGGSGAAMPTRRDAVGSWNRRANAQSDSLVEPPIYWRCFHCDLIARNKSEAFEHFGPGINERPPTCQNAATTHYRINDAGRAAIAITKATGDPS